MVEIKFIDMFGGIGGFRLGIERNKKWKCVGYYDIDKYAVQTYNKNFGEQHEATDIREIREDDIPEHDCICGGFPCQTFSIAGKRAGFSDTRGTLFFEIMRIAKAKRTKYLFLENVKGLLNHDKGKTFTVILQTLEELGYRTQWMVLNSKFFGVPQNRERVFIIASLGDEPRPEILPFRENAAEVQGISDDKKMEWYGREVRTGDKRINPLQEAHRVYKPEGIIQTLKPTPLKVYTQERKDFREHTVSSETPTLKERMGTGGNNVPMISNASPKEMKFRTECPTMLSRYYKDPKIVMGTVTQAFGRRGCSKEEMAMTEKIGQLRRLTPIECERLQGFPDNWTEGVSDTQRYKQLGNAVTVNVIEAIVKNMR